MWQIFLPESLDPGIRPGNAETHRTNPFINPNGGELNPSDSWKQILYACGILTDQVNAPNTQPLQITSLPSQTEETEQINRTGKACASVVIQQRPLWK